jgi:uncharacterized membrane protein
MDLVPAFSPSKLPVVGIFADLRTYKHLLYLLMALPLGFAYSALFSVLVFGIVFTVVGIGIIMLLAALFIARGTARFERWLANQLLDVELDTYDDVATDTDSTFGDLTKYLEAASTWRGIGFLSLKFFIAVFAFVPLFVLANGLPLLVAPLRYPYTTRLGEVNDEPVRWSIETFPEALSAALVGVVGIIIMFHLANFSAYLTRHMATALLGVEKSTADETTISQTHQDIITQDTDSATAEHTTDN